MAKKHKARKTASQKAAPQAPETQQPTSEAPTSKWARPQDVSALDMAFGGKVHELLPPWDELPACYRDANSRRSSIRFVMDWFYKGMQGLQCESRPGVDVNKALRHVRACLSSFDPPQEHKIGGVAFLVDHFFVRASTPDQTYEFGLEL